MFKYDVYHDTHTNTHTQFKSARLRTFYNRVTRNLNIKDKVYKQ